MFVSTCDPIPTLRSIVPNEYYRSNAGSIAMSVRKIPRNHRSLTGYFASLKMQRMVAFESALERDTFALLEYDPSVESYVEQPLHVYFADGPYKRVHVPDILAKYKPGYGLDYDHCLFQVKYSEELLKRWPEFHAPLRAAARYAHNRGWRFKLATERSVRSTFLRNVKQLLPYRGKPLDMDAARIVLDAVTTKGEGLTLGHLLASIETTLSRRVAAGIIWQLIACHSLFVDLDQTLTMRTEVQLP